MSNDITEVLRSVIKEELQPIKEELQQLNRRVGNIELRVETIETRVGNIENDLGNLKETTLSVQEKLLIILGQTVRLSEYHDETISRFNELATKEDLEYFDKKISEHDRDIFKIKMKS